MHSRRQIDSVSLAAIIILMVVVGLLGSGSVRADLYQVSVPVLDQSSKERRRALRSALDEVLMRSSGFSLQQLQASAALQSHIRKPEHYLLEYRYMAMPKELPDESADEMADETADETGGELQPDGGEVPVSDAEALEKLATDEPEEALPTALLQASFAPELIRELLAASSLPLWPTSRPSVLVWWLSDEPDESATGRHRDFAEMETFMQLAEQRGLPVMMPMNDRQDQKDKEAVWRFDQDTIASVAERYGSTAVLVGRSVANPAGWNGQWLFYFRDQSYVFPAADKEGFPPPWYEVENPDLLAEHGIQTAIEILLRYYAIDLSGGGRQLTLVINQVTHFKAYTEISKYLQSLEPVNSVTLLQTAADSQQYQLSYIGSLSVLQELLTLNGLLIADEPPVEETNGGLMPDNAEPATDTNINIDNNNSVDPEISKVPVVKVPVIKVPVVDSQSYPAGDTSEQTIEQTNEQQGDQAMTGVERLHEPATPTQLVPDVLYYKVNPGYF